MPDWPTLSLFIAAAAVLVVLPGPNTLYLVARSLEQGPWPGWSPVWACSSPPWCM